MEFEQKLKVEEEYCNKIIQRIEKIGPCENINDEKFKKLMEIKQELFDEYDKYKNDKSFNWRYNYTINDLLDELTQYLPCHTDATDILENLIKHQACCEIFDNFDGDKEFKYNPEKIQNAILTQGKDIDFFDSFIFKIPGLNLDALLDFYLQTKDSDLIYNFIHYAYKDYDKLEDKVISWGKPKYIIQYAEEKKNANISKLEDAIIDFNKSKFAYDFAKYVENSNAKKLQKVAINNKNKEYILLFAKNIPNADIKEIEKFFIDSNDIQTCWKLAISVDSVDFNLLQNFIIENSLEYACKLALYSSRANIELIQQKVIDSKNAKLINFLLKEVDGVDNAKLINVLYDSNISLSPIYNIISQKDILYEDFYNDLIYNNNDNENSYEKSYLSDTKHFKLYFDEKSFYSYDMEKAENDIIQNKDCIGMIKLAFQTSTANIKKLQQAIMEFGDAKQCFYFGMYASGADLIALSKCIERKGDKKYINLFKTHILNNNKLKKTNRENRITLKGEVPLILRYLSKK